MSSLTVISETGMPHSACNLDYGNRSDWVGFHPSRSRTPMGVGELDFSDRSQYIKFSVCLWVDELTLRAVTDRLVQKYQNAYYTVGVNDCVSLSVDAANWCGFRVPPRPNLIPDNLVKNLISLNLDRVVWKETICANSQPNMFLKTAKDNIFLQNPKQISPFGSTKGWV
ncbi:MAG: hypothetical protein DCE90_03845 [Pseudanabaena sp.]|nr:MAG: hypothetical protein DCE90_03845 [Pseudanabaena sp.]